MRLSPHPAASHSPFPLGVGRPAARPLRSSSAARARWRAWSKGLAPEAQGEPRIKSGVNSAGLGASPDEALPEKPPHSDGCRRLALSPQDGERVFVHRRIANAAAIL